MKYALVQANGNNVRLSKYFRQPKHDLYFRGRRIIEWIIDNCSRNVDHIFVAMREGAPVHFKSDGVTIIRCPKTSSRIETLSKCWTRIPPTGQTLIHDCDSIIPTPTIESMHGNSLAISGYKNDGLKYGFVDLNHDFTYAGGNEKERETSFITVGAYSVDNTEFSEYMKSRESGESLLPYYNQASDVGVVYSKDHIPLGDINLYMQQIWS